MNLFISITPSWWGGGSNTFAYNFSRWARSQDIRLVKEIADADAALVIAASISEKDLRRAKEKRVFLIHRLDEHFEPKEDAYRQQKHDHLKALNQYCDVTVYQSEFVRDNVKPHLNPKQDMVILNGGDPHLFKPAKEAGEWIGHVTWGVGDKKRLDLLEKAVASHPQEKFLLIGNHKKSEIPWSNYPNVRLAGRSFRFWIPAQYRRMKALFFPSQNDPCPNTVIEAILSGVPVAYHPEGGTREIVRDCGLPLDQFDDLLAALPEFRQRCLRRADLYFDRAAREYMQLYPQTKETLS